MNESEEKQMKIQNYGPSGLNPYKREMQTTETLKKNPTKANDKLEISSEALKLQQQSTDPVRQEKINSLKKQIQNGTYQINHQALAEKIYNHFHNKN
jgi:negative regulator of flagellin synthesis FlgM